MRRVRTAAIVAGLVLFGECRTYDTTYTDTASCDAGSTVCNGVACIDTTTDRSNCGACGQACAQNEICTESQCASCPLNAPVACPPLGTPGAGFCTDTSSDDNNCGGCGGVCPAGQRCVNSQCGCPLTTCGSECIDTTSDVQNCGGCNAACPPPGPGETAICTKSQCSVACIAPLADCDGNGANGCEANLQTDNANCGACQRVCTNGGACVSGNCPIVTYDAGSALSAVAVDATFVYFVDQSASGGVKKAPIAGGAVVPVSSDNEATALAIDSGRILWLHVNTEIDMQLLTGTTITPIATGLQGVQTLVTSNGFGYFSTGLLVARVASDGSAQYATIANAQDPQSIAVDATNVYFAQNTGDIRFAPIAQVSGSSSLFTAAGAVAIAVDGVNIYWMDGGGTMSSSPKTNAQPTKLSANQTITSNLVTDGVSLYWADANANIRRMPVSGGVPKVLAPTQGTVRAIAIDAANVYWTSSAVVAATTK